MSHPRDEQREAPSGKQKPPRITVPPNSPLIVKGGSLIFAAKKDGPEPKAKNQEQHFQSDAWKNKEWQVTLAIQQTAAGFPLQMVLLTSISDVEQVELHLVRDVPAGAAGDHAATLTLTFDRRSGTLHVKTDQKNSGFLKRRQRDKGWGSFPKRWETDIPHGAGREFILDNVAINGTDYHADEDCLYAMGFDFL